MSEPGTVQKLYILKSQMLFGTFQNLCHSRYIKRFKCYLFHHLQSVGKEAVIPQVFAVFYYCNMNLIRLESTSLYPRYRLLLCVCSV